MVASLLVSGCIVKPGPRKSARRIAFVYLAFGVAWIFGTDWIAHAFFAPADQRVVQTIKGWGFVGVSTVLLFGLVWREMRHSSVLERQLDETRSLMAQACQNLNDVVLTVRLPERRILTSNQAARRLFGYSEEELVGRSARVLFPTEEAFERFGQRVMGELEDRGRVRGHLTLRSRDGERVPVEYSITSLEEKAGGSGTSSRAVVALRDLSELEELEAELVSKEQRLEALVSHVSDIITVIGDDGRVTYANPSYRSLLGYDPGEVVGTQVLGLLHPEDHHRVEEALDAARNDPGSPHRLKLRAKHAGGTIRRLEAIGIYPADGSVEGVVVTARDVTEQEEQRKQLQRSYRLLHAVIEGVPDAVFVKNRGGEYELINEAGARYLGADEPEEVVGRSDERFLSDEPLQQVRSDDDRVVQSGELIKRQENIELLDGTERTFDVVKAPFYDEDGAIQGVVGVSRDVTDRETARQRFQTLFEVNPLALSISTVEEGRFVEVNEGFEELFGYRGEQVVGRSSQEIDLWVDPADRIRLLHRLQEAGQVYNQEFPMRTVRGDVVDVLLSGAVVEEGGTAYLMAAMHDITERKEFERQLERQALHDSLTGLPNRTLLRDRLSHALDRAEREKGEVAVLFLDLDEFKRVNDSLGHPAGDQLLEEVAERIKGCVRSQDTVARFGGDEFSVLLEGVDERAEIEDVAARLTEIFAEPIDVPGSEVHITASIGIAVADAEDRDPDDLFRFADAAMYQAKREGGNAFHFYGEEADYEVTRQLHRENELRQALERDELVVYYQPVVDLETETIDGVEALVRWDHPERGLLSPGEFIGMAEATGLIVPLGLQVLRSAADTVQQWRSAILGRDSRFLLTVNLSARQCAEETLPDRVAEILDQTGLPVDALGFEITETVAMQERTAVDQLRELGVRLIIDDFGTGYSTLQYLRRLEAQELKIDRSFVARIDEHPRDRAIVRAVLLMAEELGLDTVAEGLERRNEVDVLRELGCRYGQGYFFAKPMPANDMEKML